MKVLPFQIPKPNNNALILQEDIELIFYDKLHQHQEIQISYIVKGEGTLIVGDTINNYIDGDLIILGSNLPHVFKSTENLNYKSHMVTLFFTENSFGKDFFSLNELSEVQPFFKQSKHGFKISPNKDAPFSKLFKKLKKETKFNQFLIFLKLLKIITKLEYISLSSFIYEKKYTAVEGKRMRDVFEYTMSNYSSEISLDDIANKASMTKNAFCKYFKKRTNKSYFRFLNELRIENACKLIKNNKDLTLAEIAYKSGFKNISNFNRQFKSIKKKSPSNYRKII